MKALIIALFSVYCSFAMCCPNLNGVFVDSAGGGEMTISQQGCEKLELGAANPLRFVADGIRRTTFENDQIIQYRKSHFDDVSFFYTMGMERKDTPAKFIADGIFRLDSSNNMVQTIVHSSENGPIGTSTKYWVRK